MAEKPKRFGALLHQKPTPTGPAEEPAAIPAAVPEAAPTIATETGPYLLRHFSRDEGVARLGNGVRIATKHHLEDYVRHLKRGGWPATEARIMEAMFELLEQDEQFRARVTEYLTGK